MMTPGDVQRGESEIQQNIVGYEPFKPEGESLGDIPVLLCASGFKFPRLCETVPAALEEVKHCRPPDSHLMTVLY